VGKTTTRSSIAAVAAGAGLCVHSPRGNLNNLVGVPLVLLGLTEQHDLGVVELGTNHPGEIARLSEISQPDLAVLTRIALEHTEGLGDLDAIEIEEGAILRGLGPTAVAVINADDERCSRQAESCPAARQVRYGLRAGADRSAAEYRILKKESASPQRTRVRIERPAAGPLELESPLLGLPGAYALAAALAVTETLLGRALAEAEVTSALASPVLGEPGRLSVVELPDGSLILTTPTTPVPPACAARRRSRRTWHASARAASCSCSVKCGSSVRSRRPHIGNSARTWRSSGRTC
jgi:UDP-N-acetylmuramoyl-tripeptide--D-alanyl-D-alanine ligase